MGVGLCDLLCILGIQLYFDCQGGKRALVSVRYGRYDVKVDLRRVLYPDAYDKCTAQGRRQRLFSWLIRLVYALDAPTNLFPSIHCLVSWFCFIGIRKSKKLPVWFKVFSCIFAALVCMSTQFTKQHYLLDIPGGILIAELCYYITTHTEFFRKVERVFDRIGRSVFGVSYYDE